MADSKRLAGLIGPTLLALAVTEAMNYRIFASSIAPVVYFNGTVLFVAGLAIVRAHNRWTWRWPVFLTLTGWVLLLGGLFRMFAPESGRAPETASTYVFFVMLGALGAFLTFKGYGRAERRMA